MAAENALTLEQTTGLHLAPMQLKLARLLELNTPEVENAIVKELEENPALEVADANDEAEPIPYLPARRQIPEDLPAFSPADDEETLYEHLTSQLPEKELPDHIDQAARFIIGSLDPNGYLDRRIEEIADDMIFTEGLDITYPEAEEALKAVRQLDPPGIGAFNLCDTLILQLEALPQSERRDNALRILNEAYEEFALKHRDKILRQLDLSEDAGEAALSLIRSLNPRPGAQLGWSREDKAAVIVPDLQIEVEDTEIRVSLNGNIPELSISLSFAEAASEIKQSKGRRRHGDEYILRNYQEAKEFLSLLKERRKTLLTVMTAIVKFQKDYFLTRDVYALRPMMIKNIAAETGLDFSVISRATNGKYVGTPWGVFPLRFFFSDSVGENQEDPNALTNRKIEEGIRNLVEAEDKKKPMSDQQISEAMTAQGYDIARRTVAKYREKLHIPVARLRRHL